MVLLLLFVFGWVSLCGMVREESRGVIHETSKSHVSWLKYGHGTIYVTPKSVSYMEIGDVGCRLSACFCS